MPLNRQQQQAADCDENCLVIACPGSGKTSLIVSKVIRLLLSGRTVGVVTFTKDGADEVLERILKALREEHGEATAAKMRKKVVTGTFHSLCMRMLKSANQMGRLVSGREQRQYIERAMNTALADKITADRYKQREIAVNYEYASKEIEFHKCSLAYAEGNLPSRADAPIFHNYIEILQRNRVIDFSDLITTTLRLMREGKIKPIPLTDMLIDEFQDTDEVQLAWILEHHNAGIRMTAVGDDDQSIFAFRRALGYAGMETFRERTQAVTITLPVNYRCRKEILDSAGSVIGANTARMNKDLYAERGPGGVVQTCTVGDMDDLAETLLTAMQNDLLPCDDDQRFTHTVPRKSWAILARNNITLMDLSKALWKQPIAIKHFLSGGGSPWDNDPLTFYAGLLISIEKNTPAGLDSALSWAGISNTDLTLLHSRCGKDFCSRVLSGTDFDYSGLSPDSVRLLQDMHRMSGHWKARYAEGRADLVAGGVASWMKGILYAKAQQEPKRNAFYVRALNTLESASHVFEKVRDTSFESRLKRLKAVPSREEEDRGLILTTLHSSKGQEFDHVWIVNAEEEAIPGTKLESPIGLDATEPKPIIIQQNLEAERRLFYVGITRAKNSLTISWPSDRQPSRFIKETGITNVLLRQQ